MERKEIRRALAYFACAAEAGGDTELARLLAAIHTALIDDRVQHLYARLCGVGHPEHQGRLVNTAHTAPAVLRERALG